jgi:Uma2 family endonuclease
MSGMVQAERRFTAAEFDQMAAVGILHEDERVELLDGKIIIMNAMGTPHIMALTRMNHLVVPAVGPGILVVQQVPILLDQRWKPAPDLVVFHDREYGEQPLTAADILLAVEIGDTSVEQDRDVKIPRYGAAGIAESWLVDLANKRIERYTEPRPGGYRQVLIARSGESLPSTMIPGLTFAVDAIIR